MVHRKGKVSSLAHTLGHFNFEGRLRHRPHALGHPRPPERGQRPSAHQLRRPHRRGAQRHHRELRRPARGAAGGGAFLHQRHRYRGGAALVDRAGAARWRARPAVRRPLPHASAWWARTRWPSCPPTSRAPSWPRRKDSPLVVGQGAETGSLCCQRHHRHDRRHARRGGASTDGAAGASLAPRGRRRTTTAAGQPHRRSRRHPRRLGPRRRREGRIPRLHAQGDPRAAARHPRHACGPSGGRRSVHR